MQRKEIKINIDDFPSELHYIFENTRVYDSSLHPSMTVLYSDNGYYVKIAEKGSLARKAEMAKLFARNGMGVDSVRLLTWDLQELVTGI